LALNPDLHVTRQTPPQFLLQAEDDNEDNVDDSLAYYIALKKAKVPTEMHLYAQGGHAFGLRHTKNAITDWTALAEVWMRSMGMVP
jgi:dipeptidyl aminopeptidase/acylaminoacyl peptidase